MVYGNSLDLNHLHIGRLEKRLRFGDEINQEINAAQPPRAHPTVC